MLRKIIDWLFNTKLKVDNEKLTALVSGLSTGRKYIPVEIYKGVTENQVLMSPDLLQKMFDIANDSFFAYFMFDFKEDILKDKKNYSPVEFMSTLKTIDMFDERLLSFVNAYLKTQANKGIIDG